jgi:segregation and condensation protein B
MTDHDQPSSAPPVTGSVQPSLPLGPDFEPPSGDDLQALLEALLFVAREPPTIADLARVAGVPSEAVETAIEVMSAADHRGWVVLRHRETVQLASAPRFAEPIRRFLGLERESRLSGAALETVAIIAYRQPVTRAEIEAVRGVDCAGVLATLHSRGLIEPTGRLETVGHPIQYGTTPEFLRHFGLLSLDDLPPLGEVEGRDARVLLESAMVEAEDSEPIGQVKPAEHIEPPSS